MATPIGNNVVTSISRRHIRPDLVDNVYKSNVVTFRLFSANKKIVRGGYQIEQPLMYGRFTSGGFFHGAEVLDITPADTILNAAFDWKQAYVPVVVDGRTLIKVDQPEAIADFIRTYFAQAEMEMAEILATGIWSDGSNPKAIDGIEMAVDDGSIANVYGGLDRSTYGWWKSQVDSATTALSLGALNSLFNKCSEGGRHPTLIVSRTDQYERYWSLNIDRQQQDIGPAGGDSQLAAAGFRNMLFNGVPWVVDSHVPDGQSSTNSKIYMLNEDYMELVVSPRADMEIEDFQTGIYQNAMVSKIYWAGNLLFSNCARQGVMTSVTTVATS
jgi:hypothetical protein